MVCVIQLDMQNLLVIYRFVILFDSSSCVTFNNTPKESRKTSTVVENVLHFCFTESDR